eukprot:11178382-Lingulodinium_polyedra.AAC.1
MKVSSSTQRLQQQLSRCVERAVRADLHPALGVARHSRCSVQPLVHLRIVPLVGGSCWPRRAAPPAT